MSVAAPPGFKPLSSTKKPDELKKIYRLDTGLFPDCYSNLTLGPVTTSLPPQSVQLLNDGQMSEWWYTSS